MYSLNIDSLVRFERQDARSINEKEKKKYKVQALILKLVWSWGAWDLYIVKRADIHSSYALYSLDACTQQCSAGGDSHLSFPFFHNILKQNFFIYFGRSFSHLFLSLFRIRSLPLALLLNIYGYVPLTTYLLSRSFSWPIGQLCDPAASPHTH